MYYIPNKKRQNASVIIILIFTLFTKFSPREVISSLRNNNLYYGNVLLDSSLRAVCIRDFNLKFKGAVTLRNFLSNLPRKAVAKQVAGPSYTVQSFSATLNIFDRGKLKTPRPQIVSQQNNKFEHAFVKNVA